MNICYLSFPDSNSGCMGDSKFHIKIRSRGDTSCRIVRHQKKVLQRYNHICPQWNQRAETSHIYGFVYFRQTKNAQIKRGYFQKSLVLLTRLPFLNLYYKLADLIAPIFFQQPTDMDRTALFNLIYQVRSVRDWNGSEGGERIEIDLTSWSIFRKSDDGPVSVNCCHRRAASVATVWPTCFTCEYSTRCFKLIR